MTEQTKRCWTEIKLNSIAENYSILKARAGIELCAVIKADAYGHGAARVARRLYDEGARFFAVATVDEAVTLRESGLNADLLILGYTPSKYLYETRNLNLTQSIISYDALEEYRS